MIHPTALVDPQAELAADVSVGAYSLIGAGARIDSGTVIGPHVVIAGATRIGKDNQIHAFCSLGGAAQDKKYQGEPTSLEIGARNTIREFCTFNRGTANDVGSTRVGDDNWIMAYVHVAHDCEVGNNTVFANNAQLAGHVSVGDYVVLGGFTGVHQFVHLGAHSFTGIAAVVLQDLPPYVTIAGSPARPYGINSVGIRRRGFSESAIACIKRAYKTLYRSGFSLAEARERIEQDLPACPELKIFCDFLASSSRGIIR